jgi:nitrous oxide reductase accessory protein NosL
VRTLVLGIVVSIVLAGCGTDEEPGSTPAAGDEALTRAVRGVCKARDAVAGSIAPSWRIFQDEAHDALHELARQVTEENRAAAAALLEAKQRVEVAFVKDMNANGFRKLMSELVDASNAALEELSLTPVECA